MTDYLYPYTDETPEERQPRRKLLVTVNKAGRYFHAGKASGEAYNTRDDVTVFVPHTLDEDLPDWIATLEGSPDDHARVFCFRSVQELEDVIEALQVALNIAKEGK